MPHLPVPAHFDLVTTARSHGWYDLPPFAWDEDKAALSTAIDDGERAVDVVVRAAPGGVAVRFDPAPATAAARARLVAQVRAMLRLDEDLAPFYAVTDGVPGFEWVRRRGAGRLLRAPTAFEDATKMLLTTNCSWALTRAMTTRLVESLGVAAPSGRRAFPSAARMAERPAEWYRDVVRAGYRSRYLAELSARVADGSVDLESPRREAGDGAALRERLLGLPGVGPYAADNLLRLYGAYERLGLDSWCRAELTKLMPRARDIDAAAERRYARFGRYAGLAMWVELTRRWHADE